MMRSGTSESKLGAKARVDYRWLLANTTKSSYEEWGKGSMDFVEESPAFPFADSLIAWALHEDFKLFV
ncbi:hypothetical protein ACOSQ3_023633 [Xanthoceras sorbifolium]